MDRFTSRALVLSLGLVALGCDDLALDDDKETSRDTATTAPSGGGATAASDTSTREVVVDATDREAWTYLDLDSGTQDKSEAAVAGWDVALQRSNLKLKAGGRASLLAGAEFESVAEAPREGWGSDVTTGDKPTYFLSSGDTTWYDYDASTHALTPKPNVYVVQTDRGYQKLAVLAWTNDAGTPAVYRLKVGTIAAPRGAISERDAEVDVSTSASRASDAGSAK